MKNEKSTTNDLSFAGFHVTNFSTFGDKILIFD